MSIDLAETRLRTLTLIAFVVLDLIVWSLVR
jgi:hypothetical protein